jgi:hypothetical protein
VFSTGDRVQIENDYFAENLRGPWGTIVEPELTLSSHITDGDYWVEFDQPHPHDEDESIIEAGAFSRSDLHSAK